MDPRSLVRHSSVCACALVLAACATNPATGNRELALISEAQEIEMGRQASQDVGRTFGFVDDQELQTYVQGIGKRLAASSERPNLPWEFHVVDDPTPNAFALPGGFIYVTRGMMNLMTSEAELASVLGHEIAHVTARHSVSQLSKQQLAQLGLGLGGIFFPAVQEASPLIGTGLGLLFLKYGRDDERQADELGFGYATRQGYAAAEFGDVFEALARSADKQEGGGIPDWLSTHPAPAERVETARKRAESLPPQAAGQRVGETEFLTQIDGLVYGENPRHGFFRDNAFYHPDLRFQLEFPGGWQRQNLPQAVVAAAPDGSAAFELTLTGAETAQQALNGFAQQPGLQFGQPVQRDIAGNRAVGAEFVAETQGGRLRGLAAFIEHGGRVYQLVGYGAANRYGAYAPAIDSIVRSFRTVTDRAILDVQPNRIDIVRLPRQQTLAEFAKQFPSAVPVEQLAVLNHLPGPSARIDAGALVKRVVS